LKVVASLADANWIKTISREKVLFSVENNDAAKNLTIFSTLQTSGRTKLVKEQKRFDQCRNEGQMILWLNTFIFKGHFI